LDFLLMLLNYTTKGIVVL